MSIVSLDISSPLLSLSVVSFDFSPIIIKKWGYIPSWWTPQMQSGWRSWRFRLRMIRNYPTMWGYAEQKSIYTCPDEITVEKNLRGWQTSEFLIYPASPKYYPIDTSHPFPSSRAVQYGEVLSNSSKLKLPKSVPDWRYSSRKSMEPMISHTTNRYSSHE